LTTLFVENTVILFFNRESCNAILITRLICSYLIVCENIKIHYLSDKITVAVILFALKLKKYTEWGT